MSNKINDGGQRKKIEGRPCHSLAILGTMSDAGKTILTAGLCRILASHGVSVAPFKAQNMSNNSSPALLPSSRHHHSGWQTKGNVVSSCDTKASADDEDINNEITKYLDNIKNDETHQGYGEIGTAQALQAEACYISPRVEMNPVLLKSGGKRESDGAYLCSVLVMGKQIACEDYGSLKFRTTHLQSVVIKAHEDLANVTGARVILIEGAGSCTELNLMDRDIVNLPLVRLLSCPWLLVANIDCGGVFAQIVGTKACLPSSDWDLCAGIIINKLRGELKYFDPGPQMIEAMVGKPVFVVPYLENLNLPEEDGSGTERRLANEYKWAQQDKIIEQAYDNHADGLRGAQRKIVVVVIAYPYMSIADDLRHLEADNRFIVQWRRKSIPLPYPITSTVILPGSRLTRADLNWLTQDSKWGDFLREHVRAGGSVLGLCGGYQMLGISVEDRKGVEGSPGLTMGLKFLPIHTVIESADCKVVRPRHATLLVNASLKREIQVKGFELHCGRSTVVKTKDCLFVEEASPLLIFENGDEEGQSTTCVKGTYLHGVLQSAEARKYLLVPPRRLLEFEMDTSTANATDNIDELDRLASHLQHCGLSIEVLARIIGLEI